MVEGTEFTGYSAAAIIIVIAANIIFLLFVEAVWSKLCCCFNSCCKAPIFISNRSPFVGHKTKPEAILYWDVLDRRHVIDSYFGPPVIVFCVRMFAFGFFWFTIIYQGTAGSGLGSSFLSYFTNWTFILFGAYGLVGVLVSAYHLIAGKQSSRVHFTLMEQVLVLLVQMVSALGLMLSVFYWAAVYDGETIELDNPLKHGINVVVMLVEVMLGRVPFVSAHMSVMMLYGTIYMIFMWGAYADLGSWKYSALDWTKSSSVGYYILLPILFFIAFVVFYGIACLREFLGSGICPCQGITQPKHMEQKTQFEALEMAAGRGALGEAIERGRLSAGPVTDAPRCGSDCDSMESVDLEMTPLPSNVAWA